MKSQLWRQPSKADVLWHPVWIHTLWILHLRSCWETKSPPTWFTVELLIRKLGCSRTLPAAQRGRDRQHICGGEISVWAKVTENIHCKIIQVLQYGKQHSPQIRDTLSLTVCLWQQKEQPHTINTIKQSPARQLKKYTLRTVMAISSFCLFFF